MLHHDPILAGDSSRGGPLPPGVGGDTGLELPGGSAVESWLEATEPATEGARAPELNESTPPSPE